jgi:chromosomal replication initiator protein
MSDLGGKTASIANNNKGNGFEAASLAPSPAILSLWKKVHQDMRNEFGEAIFRSWLKPLTLQAYYHGTMEVSVPTRFMRDWIQNHYSARILQMCSGYQKAPDRRGSKCDGRDRA